MTETAGVEASTATVTEVDAAPDPGNEPEPASQVRQATVHTFDANTGNGSVITDAGLVIPFPASSWHSGRLLTLRVGQRVRVTVEGSQSDAHVTALTLVTFSH